jgi:hypothetical protein
VHHGVCSFFCGGARGERVVLKGVSQMTEKQPSQLARESAKFLSKHKGHRVEAPPCADSFYFNLWCVTCERGISGRGKARVKRRSFV